HSHCHILVYHEAVEVFYIVVENPIHTAASDVLRQRHPEFSRKLREVWRIHEALCILAVSFIVQLPKELVFEEGTAKPATKIPPLEGRLFRCGDGLIQPLVRGITGVAEETESGSVDDIRSALGDDVDSARGGGGGADGKGRLT